MSNEARETAKGHKVPYTRVRKEFIDNALRHAEIPGEHAVSLPVPTLRWSIPVFTAFAGPAARAPGHPLRLAPPDRWWALHAYTGKLVGYALVNAVPFAETLGVGEVVVDRSGRTIPQLNEDMALLDELMDAVAPAFLDGTDATRAARSDLVEALTAVVTPGPSGWYRALAPDFFRWLEA